VGDTIDAHVTDHGLEPAGADSSRAGRFVAAAADPLDEGVAPVGDGVPDAAATMPWPDTAGLQAVRTAVSPTSAASVERVRQPVTTASEVERRARGATARNERDRP
jgi:hypothetical protein